MPRVALVLGAGGPVGLAFHAGVLAALAAEGWDAREADLLVGTSVGAVVGALLRAGLAPADLYSMVVGADPTSEGATIIEAFGGWPTFAARVPPVSRLDGLRSRPWELWGRLVAHPSRLRLAKLIGSVLPEGTVPMTPLADAIDRVLPAWPEGHLAVCGVDPRDGLRHVLDAGSGVAVGAAVAASCAVPGYFVPVEAGDRRLVDGGVHSPASADLIGPGQADEIVVSLPMGIGAWPGRLGVDLPGRLANQLGGRRGLARAAAAGARVRMLAPGPEALAVMGFDAFDTSRLDEIARRAFTAVAGVPPAATGPATAELPVADAPG